MFLLPPAFRTGADLSGSVASHEQMWMYFYQPGRLAVILLYASVILVSCQQPSDASMADEL
jgi:hypothetical protein